MKNLKYCGWQLSSDAGDICHMSPAAYKAEFGAGDCLFAYLLIATEPSVRC